jgi:hypothetical protein
MILTFFKIAEFVSMNIEWNIFVSRKIRFWKKSHQEKIAFKETLHATSVPALFSSSPSSLRHYSLSVMTIMPISVSPFHLFHPSVIPVILVSPSYFSSPFPRFNSSPSHLLRLLAISMLLRASSMPKPSPLRMAR